MKLLCLLFIIPAVFGKAGIHRSNLNDSSLCNQWKCLNTKLGLSDALPPISQTEETLKRLLPEGAWHHVLANALQHCYGARSERFTNTCSGQGFLHCVVVQMNENCPEASLRKDAACSPVSTLAGLDNMFWQSRYENFEKNLRFEDYPAYIRSYYTQKCCDLPVMFNTTLLRECGFSAFMTYYSNTSS